MDALVEVMGTLLLVHTIQITLYRRRTRQPHTQLADAIALTNQQMLADARISWPRPQSQPR